MRTLLLAGLWALCLTQTALAEEVKTTHYGKWQVSMGPDFVDAYTTNDQDQQFGISCMGGCVGMVSPPYRCENGEESVALFNSDEGAFFLRLKCSASEDDAVFTFKDNPLAAFKNKTDVAVAFPGVRATFVTMRFSLDGAREAIAHVDRELEKRK